MRFDKKREKEPLQQLPGTEAKADVGKGEPRVRWCIGAKTKPWDATLPHLGLRSGRRAAGHSGLRGEESVWSASVKHRKDARGWATLTRVSEKKQQRAVKAMGWLLQEESTQLPDDLATLLLLRETS